MKSDIRKIVVTVEETHRESGKSVSPVTRKAAAVAVIANPYAGKFVDDLTPLMDIGEELGTRKAVEALGIEGGKAESYGKAAIVGEGGELEHAAAILHPKLGKPVREVLSKGAALIPSAKKMGGIGTPVDVPHGHKDAAVGRTHIECNVVRRADAPRARPQGHR